MPVVAPVPPPIIADSITHLGPAARGCAALAASHAGVYAAYLAARAGLKAVILSDAGIGRERAGIAGLDYLDRCGMAAAAIGHRSARIGDGQDCLGRGRITFANTCAARLGIEPDMPARVALDRLAAADLPAAPAPPPLQETRHALASPDAPGVSVQALDSASLVTPADAGAIVVTGSHGALLGGRPQAAIKAGVFAGIFNDADFGADDAGISRLPALDAQGIAAATVSAWSARIGDGLSSYRDGFISAVNARARAHGAEVGLSAAETVRRLAAARHKELRS